MLRRSTLLAVTFALIAACGSKKDKDTSGSTGSATTTGSATAGSATAGSATGSDTAGSAGSAAAGSDAGSAAGSGSAAGAGSDAGSAAAGSGSDAGSAAAGSGSDAAGSAAAGSGGDVPFDKLSKEDKVKFMKTKVMPAMKAAFQKFDPKEFTNFTCKTCHGKDPQGSKYEMPTKDLPALDFAALEKGDEAEEAKFMNDVVKPTMAKLLGEPEMSRSNPKGFGCLDCHLEKK